ncbi:fumarate reductase/succinate dehydrogenase flavoprotein subunit [Jatrophihabitans sp. YIM 134969]
MEYTEGDPIADTKAPAGPIADRWTTRKFEAKLVNPANRRKHKVIVVGTGLAGGAAGATLAEQGYHVIQFCFQDSPRRAHSVAAQGGINAAKNYRNDGDSVHRLFYDTIKGGDFRSRESNVHRLAEISLQIIDQCVAQGVPFAREYGGLLDTRSFGGVQVQRTFYARGQTGQQLLYGAYQALERQIDAGNIEMHPRTEMLDLIVVDGRARGIVARDLVTGELTTYTADAVVLATGGYGNVFYLSTNAKGSNASAIWRAHRRGAYLANPCFTQIHPTCIPRSGDYQSKLTLMSESLRNDGRIWVPKQRDDDRAPADIPEDERDYYLERIYPAFGNLVPRDIASRAAKNQCDEGKGVGPGGLGVYLDFRDAIERMGRETVEAKYGNLFDMYAQITGENPYETPMRIYPAVHYTMGGLWVDYDLQTTIPGLFAIGEANFSDHGANRLGASALMQGLSDGYFVLPPVLNDYVATAKLGAVDPADAAVAQVELETAQRIEKLLSIRGNRTVDSFHRELGLLVWDMCGMSRSEPNLRKALERIPELRAEFWTNVIVPGTGEELNRELEKANRVADFLEFAELMCLDALAREESCGGHFREEHQTPDGEAERDDEHFSHVAAWEFTGVGKDPVLHKEALEFEYVHLAQRSYA